MVLLQTDLVFGTDKDNIKNMYFFYCYCYTVHVVELLNYYTNHYTYIKCIKFTH